LQPPPLPLTDLQVAHSVRAFRWNCVDRADLVGDPPSGWTCLYREAARIAGDEEPDLRRELPAVIDHLRHTAPPLGAVRVRQFGGPVAAEHEDPSVTRFTGAPASVVVVLSEHLRGPVLPMPVEDRFSQVIIQTGLSASWALAMSGQRPRRSGMPSAPATSNGHQRDDSAGAANNAEESTSATEGPGPPLPDGLASSVARGE